MTKPKTDRRPGRPPEYDEPRAELRVLIPAAMKDELTEKAKREKTSVTKIVTHVLAASRGRW